MTEETTALTAAPKSGPFARLRNYFLTGLIVAAPIGITIYLVWSFITTIDGWIKPLIPDAYNPDTYLGFAFPGWGVLTAVLFLTILGALTANFFGRFLIRLGEKILNRMPIINSIYSTLKQVFETVMSSKSNSFQKVVLVEYPRPGLWTLGFVSGANEGEVQRRLGGNIINIFIPTTPNPTSGFMLFVRKEDVIYLDMSIDAGLKYVISAGLVAPQEAGEIKKP
jgi:uncharacterized membrane protein